MGVFTFVTYEITYSVFLFFFYLFIFSVNFRIEKIDIFRGKHLILENKQNFNIEKWLRFLVTENEQN